MTAEKFRIGILILGLLFVASLYRVGLAISNALYDGAGKFELLQQPQREIRTPLGSWVEDTVTVLDTRRGIALRRAIVRRELVLRAVNEYIRNPGVFTSEQKAAVKDAADYFHIPMQ